MDSSGDCIRHKNSVGPNALVIKESVPQPTISYQSMIISIKLNCKIKFN